MDEKWQATVPLETIPEGKPFLLKVGGKTLLTFRQGAHVSVFSCRCPHYGLSLEKALVINQYFFCPWHLAKFDLKTGQVQSPPALTDLESYQVKVEEGMVFVRRSVKAKKAATVKEKPCFVILGAGAAGTAAALELRRCGFDGRIVLVSKETELPYDRPSLTKEYLTGAWTDQDIILKSAKDYQDEGIEIFWGSKVVEIKTSVKKVILQKGGELSYDKLLLATGASPRRLRMKGAELPGFFYLRSRQDAQAIRQWLPGCEKAVVIGSGFLGLEVASSLRKKALKVSVVTPDILPLNHILGKEVGEFFYRLHQSQGVIFYLENRVVSVSGRSRVEAVTLSDGQKVEAELVIAGAGIELELDYARKTELFTDQGVIVDEKQRTSDPDIMAAGDIALVPSSVPGQRLRVEHWAEAQRQGQQAARSMLGLFSGETGVPFFWTRQYNTTLRYVGFTGNFDTAVIRGRFDQNDFLVGYFYQGRPVGFGGVGRTQELVLLGELLRKKVSINKEEFAKLVS